MRWSGIRGWWAAALVWTLVLLLLALCDESKPERCVRSGGAWVERQGVVGCVKRIE